MKFEKGNAGRKKGSRNKGFSSRGSLSDRESLAAFCRAVVERHVGLIDSLLATAQPADQIRMLSLMITNGFGQVPQAVKVDVNHHESDMNQLLEKLRARRQVRIDREAEQQRLLLDKNAVTVEVVGEDGKVIP